MGETRKISSLNPPLEMGETGKITPLIPPWKWGKPLGNGGNRLEMGETRKISSLPFARGGLGWGNLCVHRT